MSGGTPDATRQPHLPGGQRQSGIYPRREWLADSVIHLLGLAAGLVAAPAIIHHSLQAPLPALAYAGGLLAMLLCSAGYNLSPQGSRARPLWRRLDRGAIFLMIAGTCTVFTARSLAPGWAEGGVVAIWLVALAGMAPALAYDRRFERMQLAACLLLGWGTLTLLLLAPSSAPLSAGIGWLVFVGGLLYSGGVLVHLAHRLPYQNAIWHLMVLLAAATHYAAIWRVLSTG